MTYVCVCVRVWVCVCVCVHVFLRGLNPRRNSAAAAPSAGWWWRRTGRRSEPNQTSRSRLRRRSEPSHTAGPSIPGHTDTSRCSHTHHRSGSGAARHHTLGLRQTRGRDVNVQTREALSINIGGVSRKPREKNRKHYFNQTIRKFITQKQQQQQTNNGSAQHSLKHTLLQALPLSLWDLKGST